MKSLALGLLLGCGMALGTASAVHAHAAQTDYYVDLFATELELEFTASFSSGEPMAGAEVTVYAPNDAETPWQESQTDDLGHFTFVPDDAIAGDWRIEFKQGGHEDIRIVPISEAGIDYESISQEHNQDVHFAQPSWGIIGLSSAIAVGVLTLAVRQRLSEKTLS